LWDFFLKDAVIIRLVMGIVLLEQGLTGGGFRL